MSIDEWIRLGVALGVGGVVLELVRSFFQRRKMGADYAEVISRSAVGLLAPLEERVHDLETKLGKSETRCRVLHEQLAESEGRANALTRNLGECRLEVHALRQQLTECRGRN